ncbi:hypothetical protein SEVCU139_0818 [Staphylococcus lugdunensis VCU139]|nr:hypothetical protein SEVCU139_0818 [Staphylococcus lugdunensis VCU139]
MNKKIFLAVIILISIVLITGAVYLKMKYDEKKKKNNNIITNKKKE